MRLILAVMEQRTAIVTGVSRRVGIAWAVAERLMRDGWRLSLCGWPAHDQEQPWGADEKLPALGDAPWHAVDFRDAAAPARVVAEHVARFGSLTAVVAVHARSSAQSLATVTAEELDASFAVNTRATVLLVQEAARAGVQRVVLFTTGVHRDPMPSELPYATSKAALQGITATLAAALATTGATVNCINPGPVDTGYADSATLAEVAAAMPLGQRWGTPQDIAACTSWLLSSDAGWLTGQTLDIDGGWSIRSGAEPR
jgi:3-oxoacyl-[acyl-carrier protein] reductase